MKGDFSRLTFDPKKHYSGVLMQQGRVQLDADWNEQQEIGRHRDEVRAADLVGPNGTPKAGAGFRIGRAPDNKNLTVSPGRFYVDGVVLENEREDVTLSKQPDLREPIAPTPGTHVVYLEVWERHVGPLEDPSVLESALGGPDTATRTKTVWQVRHLRLANPAVDAKPELFGPGWAPKVQAPRGELDARARPEEDPGDGLLLPPRAGYTRLENQLYRVEIHEGGQRGTATFKWSRENASVATAIGGASGNVLTVQSVGKDDVLGFARDQWVEVLEDGTELDSGRGELMRVGDVDPEKREITLTGTLPTTIAAHLNDEDRHPKLRRWDQSAGASGSGVPTSSPDPDGWIPLESGVEVRFRDKDAAGNPLHYETGDYWLIPARTASNAVEWPPDPASGPTFRPPRGMRRRHAALALVTLKSDGTFDPPTDLRRTFPAATDIAAEDVSFDNAAAGLPSGTETVQEALDALARINDRVCTFVVAPTPGWESAFEQIGDHEDAYVCFQPGNYTLEQPIKLHSKGNLTISGSGWGTRIEAPTSESVFSFNDCRSVLVRDLQVLSGAAGSQGNLERLNGTLDFLGCDYVAVEGVEIWCADGITRAASCVRVDAAWTCRVRHCKLSVGHQQVGILLNHIWRHAHIEGNTVSSREIKNPAFSLPKLIEGDKGYRARLRRMLISHARAGDQPHPIGHQESSRSPVTVTFGGHKISFRTPAGGVAGEWSRLVNRFPPPTVTDARVLLRHLEGLADRILLKDAAIMNVHTPFKNWYDQTILGWDPPVMAQGVVIVGSINSVASVNVLDNQIGGAVQGIHLGPTLSGKATLANNLISVLLPASEMASERHGVFVGNCYANLSVENNQVSVQRGPGASDVPIDGIRLYGYLGDMMTVRQNHLVGFTIGVFVRPLNGPATKPGWLVADNLASGPAPPGRVVVKVLDPHPPGTPSRVRTRDNLP